MRISELSHRSGRSIATIKYYLREGLLPAGHRTSANQADYGDDHLRRLRLITILLEVGGLSITSIKLVVDAIDDESYTVHEVLGAAHHALALRGATAVALPEHDEAESEIDEYVRTLGWNVTADAPGRRELAAVLVSLRRMGWRVDAGVFDEYARAADQIAQWELAHTPDDADRTAIVEAVVIGTVAFETALVALRRLAEEHHSATRYQHR